MRIKLLLSLGLLLVISFACNEDDLVQLNPNLVTPDKFFQDAGQLETAVLSGYASLRSQHMTLRHYYFIHDQMDDDHLATSANQIEPLLVVGQQNASSLVIRQHFDAHYDMIHRMNTALDGIAGNETVDDATKLNLEAEAKFLRGWSYNEVATLWGRAPIYTTRALSLDEYAPISERDAVFAQAQSDLRFAMDNLPEDRPGSEIGRATKGAAMGFLARSLMQSGNVAGAKPILQQIVDSGKYSLNENFGDNFTEENYFTPESLFEVVFAQNGAYNWDDAGDSNWGGGNSRSARAQEYGPFWRNIIPSSEALNAFASEVKGDRYTDPRFAETIIIEGQTYLGGTEEFVLNRNSDPIEYNGEEIWANFYKYGVYYKEVPGGFRLSNTNFILMRYADVLLLLAEAEVRTDGDLDKARSLINQVRARAGAPNLDDSGIANGSTDELMAAVIKEREVELMSEQVRGRDLRRWHAAGIVNAEAILGYKEGKFVLPIPQDEITNNPMVSQADQNPGYQ
ncbi:RagB/SusD family nutrient uptake outer membrane protein [Neolewinella sp.]|uniref:RagB/SusD family nutrient uptake outer membrane protein n=1 Tax=Neolewinella sp. TaxID=2993543 RepID=UPI003B52CE9A